MNPEVYTHFMALLREEELEDPSWINTLREFDEPPLFTTTDQVEFLRALPERQRILDTVEFTLSTLELIATEASHSTDNVFFLCATFSDFSLWREMSQLVPTPAIYVNPHDDESETSGVPFVEPRTADGLLIASALDDLGPAYSTRYCVGELQLGSSEDSIERVYLGWRDNPSNNIRSIGLEMMPQL